MTRTITITLPTEEELADRLGGIERLMTAKQWERAAIVWAFTTNNGPGQPQKNPRKSRDSFPVSMDRFAELGYQGLRWAETVARYRKTWQNAINAGHAKKVRPGDKVDLPDLVWSEWYDSTDGHPRYRNEHADELRAEAARQGVGPSKVIDVAQNLGALGVAIAADPKAADKAMAALRSSGRLREAVDTDPEVAAEVAASDSVRRKVDENYRKMAERGRAGSHPVEPKPAHVRDGRLIDALDHILRAAMHTRSAVNDLEGVTLTEDERRRFTAEHEQLANWVEGLRARIAGGDLDDELRALLEAEK